MAELVSQPDAQSHVSGTITFANGSPAASLSVRAIDRSVGIERELGIDITNDNGNFDISYSTAELGIVRKTAADVELRVFDSEATLLFKSALHPKAPAELTVNVSLDYSPPVPSEYEQLLSIVQPHLGETQLTELTEADIDYLTKVTNQDAKLIEKLAASARCAIRLAESNDIQIPQGVIYGLLSYGLASDPSALAREPVYRLNEALNRAVAENIILPPNAEAMDKLRVVQGERTSARVIDVVPSGEEGDWLTLILDAFRQVRFEQELMPADQGQRMSVADLFAAPANAVDDAPMLDPDLQRDLAALIAADPDAMQKLDPSSLEEQGFEPVEIATVKRHYALAELTHQHKPLVFELSARSVVDAAAPNGNLAYLAELQFYDWQGLVEKTGVPPDIEGEDEATRKANYAAMLESGVEKAHRTSVIAARIRQERLFVPEAGKNDLTTFFRNNPNFEFGKQYVQVILAEGSEAKLEGIEDPIALTHNLSALERTVKLTDNHRQQNVLLANGLDSAQKIARIGRRDVIANLTARPEVDEQAAKAIFSRAEHIAAMASALFMRFREHGLNLPVFQAVDTVEMTDAPPATSLKQIPDLTTLFGSLDSCACESCQSVLSPAAYYVDIMKYLEDRKIDLNRTTLDILLSRRPDLAEIELSCENSNTVLPYVDLVTEILERAAGRTFPHAITTTDSGAVVASLDAKHIPDELISGLTTIWPALAPAASVEVITAGKGWLLKERGRRLTIENFAGSFLLHSRDGGWEKVPQDANTGDVQALDGNIDVPQSIQLAIGGRQVNPRGIQMMMFPTKFRSNIIEPGKEWRIHYSYELLVRFEFPGGDSGEGYVEDISGARFEQLGGAALANLWRSLEQGVLEEYLANSYFSNHTNISIQHDTQDNRIWRIWDHNAVITAFFRGLSLTNIALQTSDHEMNLAASPEHMNVTAYQFLRDAVYPWQIPFDLWTEEARVYLTHLGVPKHVLMETFYRDSDWQIPELGNPGIRRWRTASERLGLIHDEVEIIAGIRKGAGSISDPDHGPWNFWGLSARALSPTNSIPDPAESTRRITSGQWPQVLTDRVDVLLQQAGISFEELRELLDMHFVNTRLGGSRVLALSLSSVVASHNISLDQVITRTGEREEAYVPLNGTFFTFSAPADINEPITFRFAEFHFSYEAPGTQLALDVRLQLDGKPIAEARFITPDESCRIVIVLPTLAIGSHTIYVMARRIYLSGDRSVVGLQIRGVATLEAMFQTCNLSLAKLERLAAPVAGDLEGVLDRMHRFIRLWRKLRWSMPDLDRALVQGSVTVVRFAVPDDTGGAVKLSFGDFTFDYPPGPSTMALDVRFVMDGQPLAQRRFLDRGLVRLEFIVPFLSPGSSRSISVEARTVLLNGPPTNDVRLTGSATLMVILYIFPQRELLSQSIHLDQSISFTDTSATVGSDGSFIAVLDSKDVSGFLSDIEWTKTYLTQRFQITGNYQNISLLSTAKYTDYRAVGVPAIPSLYEELFLNNRRSESADDTFQLNSDLTEIKGVGKPCSDYVSHISAACTLSIQDTQRLIDAGETELSLKNLTRLFFSARAARGAEISIWEYVQLESLCRNIVPGQPLATRASIISDVAFALRRGGMTASEAIYLLAHKKSIDDSDAEIRNAALTLNSIRNTLRSIVNEENSILASAAAANLAEPNEESLRGELLSLNWAQDVIDEIIDILTERKIYEQPLAGLPAGVDLPHQNVPYVTYESGKLICSRIPKWVDMDTLQQLAPDVQEYTSAILTLFTEPRKYVMRTLCSYMVVEFKNYPRPWRMEGVAIPIDLTERLFVDPIDKSLHFIGPMSDAMYARLLSLSTTIDWKAEIDELRDAWQNDDMLVFGRFFDSDETTVILNDISVPQSRFAYLLDKLAEGKLQSFVRARRIAALQETLASILGFESRTIGQLLNEWLDSARASDFYHGKSIEDFLDPLFIQSTLDIELTPDKFPRQFESYLRLSKLSTFAEKFKLTHLVLGWLFAPASEAIGWLDLNKLPTTDNHPSVSVKGLLRIFNLLQVRDQIPGGENTLSQIFALAKDSVTTGEALLQRLASLTGWNIKDIQTLVGETGFNLTADVALKKAFVDEWLLYRLIECFAVMKRLGATAEQCLRWTKGDLGSMEAVEIKSLARSRHSDSSWAEVVKPVRNALREKQRHALVSYLIAKQQMRDSNDLYSYFLIDVEMSPCAMTSRIKQACASIQLFVQRCLLKLEPDVPPSTIDTKLWGWMKNYRVWEANRKVFLYPENWIEPELRDDKSEFFRQLESDLLQSNVTHEAGLEAFKSYIEKLTYVARVTIVTMFGSINGEGSRQTHILGHDSNDPRRYFYREWTIPPLSDAGYWSPWEEVNVGINGSHVLIFIFGGAINIAWMSVIPDGQSEMFKITMNVVRRSLSGWSTPRRAHAPLYAYPAPNIDDSRALFFQVVEGSGEMRTLRIECWALVFEKAKQSNSNFPLTNPIKPRDFVFAANEFIDDTVSSMDPAVDIDIRILCRYVDNYRRTFYWEMTDISQKLVMTVKVDITKTKVGDTGTGGRYYGVWEGNHFIVKNTGLKGALIKESPEIAGPGQPKFVGACHAIDLEIDIQAGHGYRPQKSVQHFDIAGCKNFSLVGDFIVDVIDPALISDVNLDEDRVSDIKNNSSATYLNIGRFSFEQDGQITTDSSLKNTNIYYQFLESQPCESVFLEVNRGLRSGKDDFKNLTHRFLKSTPGRFMVTPSVVGTSAQTWSAFAYRDKDLDLIFYAKSAQDRYRILPVSLWWTTTLNVYASFGDFDRLTSLQNMKAHQSQIADIDSTSVVADDPLHSFPANEIRFDDCVPQFIYNWETFFHIPLLIASALTNNQRFEEAQRWLHIVFDPTLGRTDSSSRDYWRFKPFRVEPIELSIEQELVELAVGGSDLSDKIAKLIDAWKKLPFQPHLIARSRHRAYQFFVVLKYVDNLISWGDQLFRRDTIESINEATQYYILASEILGRRPRRISTPTKRKAKTYLELPNLDDFSNALVQVESLLPAGGTNSGGGGENFPPTFSLYFCIPQNEKLASYWDTVDDRLFKIRHCMNIEGIERQLALYEPPIDPALLVRATAAGLDIASVLADLQTPLPRYRFNVMAQRAQDVAGDVRAFGAALLTAMEKHDGESLALLRSTQEVALLKLVTLVRTGQHEEALANVASLRKTRELIAQRYLQYQRLIGKSNIEVPPENAAVALEATPGKAPVTRDIADADLAGLGLSKSEVDHLGWMNVANNYTITSGSFQIASSVGHLFPNIQTGTPFLSTKFGGGNIGNALGALGSLFAMLSSNASFQGTRAATIGGHQRRFDEWALQSNLAAKELEQIDKQIAAAELRVAIAEQELTNHQKQIENAQAVDDFMHDKFTNLQLYRWMSGQVAGLYFRAYQLAYDLAKRAEKAYRNELGLEDKDSNYIQFGYWDSLKRGLLAGEKLSFDIKRMEAAYLDKNRREFEITKHVSLRRLAPDQLVLLRSTGESTFDIPEWLFDLDGSGQYMRRLKNVSLSVPCIVGPYMGMHCKLTQLKSEVRVKPIASNKDDYPRKSRDAGDDTRFVDYQGAIESMVTSSGNNDSGLFETNFRDERYLPFENSGAISTWRIELPDPTLSQFDYKTISDVIIHLRYTSRDGGDTLRQAAQSSAKEQLQKAPGVLLILVKDEFPTEWARMSANPDTVSLDLTITANMLPYSLSKIKQRKSVKLFDATIDQSTNNPAGFKILENENMLKALDEPIVLGSRTVLMKNTGGADPFLLVELG
jgi:Tc toxin complex TcA C-terminal TcB-binding domain/Neuraminidase-like domain/Salmonella virulence plasmid 28.1kDa A protein